MKPATTLTLLMTISITLAQQADIVGTTLGPIQGLRKIVDGKAVDVYYGIPFAKPPVGELRFKRPEPAEPWTDVKSTVTKPNACMQIFDMVFGNFSGTQMWNPNTPISEDCLYLNVWVPRAYGNSPPNTTMVWIYGGGFFSGSSALDIYDASKLSTTQNVIVASMNYRVGMLGFLYTGTTDAPGNQGLLDQALALKWIYDNVVSFGGQQNSITIFGESAGSISVGLHLLSPVSMNYFTRAIMQSGSPFTDIYLTKSKAKQRAQKLAALLSCPWGPESQMIQCLQNVSAEKITQTQWASPQPGVFVSLPAGVVMDDYFLKDDPHTVVAKGRGKDTQLLTGSNKDEGTYFLVYSAPSLFPLHTQVNFTDAQFQSLVGRLNDDGQDVVVTALLNQYVDSVVPELRASQRDTADDILGDRLFVCPTADFASVFASRKGHRDVYTYSFQHRLSNNPWPDWMGVMHGYEIEAVFGLPRPYNYTQAELDLADRMMGYWTRFAQTGNPNSGGAVLWPKLTAQEDQYLKVRAQGDSVEQGLRRQPCTLRSTLLPLLKCRASTSGTTPTLSPPLTAYWVVCLVFLFMI